jgi:hypothetical protein
MSKRPNQQANGDPNTPFPVTSGFEAIAFQRGTEIVISYAGTYVNTAADIVAN